MRIYATAFILILVAACGGSPSPGPGAAGGPGRGGAPATGVQILTLQQRPIEVSSDFISTVRSLHSTTIQPQVEGRVTSIFVKSGDVVRAGAPLLQIDPEHQAATVRNTESQRSAREADVTYWKSQVERLQSLLKAGAISQNEFDTAQHNYLEAQANLSALDAQVKQDQVQLHYYQVTAPTTGVVGESSIREGDRVTTSTPITTIDDKAGLEAYIEVPVDRAPELRVGLTGGDSRQRRQGPRHQPDLLRRAARRSRDPDRARQDPAARRRRRRSASSSSSASGWCGAPRPA